MVEKHAAEKEKRRLELKELRKQSKNRQLTQLRGQTLEVPGIVVVSLLDFITIQVLVVFFNITFWICRKFLSVAGPGGGSPGKVCSVRARADGPGGSRGEGTERQVGQGLLQGV